MHTLIHHTGTHTYTLTYTHPHIHSHTLRYEILLLCSVDL